MKKATLLATSVLALVTSSCNDSKFDGFTKAENGLHYKFFNHDESGTKIQKGDGIIFRYVISNQKNDSVIVDSKNVSEDGSGYVKFLMGESTFKGSFEDGMLMMAKGDSAEFIVSADSFFLKTNRQNELPKGIMAGDHLKGVFKIKDIRTKKELEANQKQQQAEQEARQKEMEALAKEMEPKEKPAMEKYIKDNNIKVKPTASGLYYMEIKKGSGPSPKATDMVKVIYKGTLLDGTEFDSSDKHGGAVEFGVNQVIPGWTEALQLMRKGGKAKLLIPSAIAYGPRGGGPIPPYSPLVFELELIDIMAAPEQAPGSQPGQ
jgi:FKBP-type peptidyl-prolyl cis-trans isomerase FkpA